MKLHAEHDFCYFHTKQTNTPEIHQKTVKTSKRTFFPCRLRFRFARLLRKDSPLASPLKVSAEELKSAKDEGRIVLLEFETARGGGVGQKEW